MHSHLADFIMIPIQVAIIFFTIYYTGMALFGFHKKKEIKYLTPKNKFALLIAAHNEEAVISQLVKNLELLNYPRSMYDIFVIADNCTDKTAEMAEKAGAIVYKRFNDQEKGKGFAMEWMFAKLFAKEKKYDAVCIFDADNLVHPEFLTEMNSRLHKGQKIIQGYMDAKNAKDTWVSATFAMAFWVINHIWHLAKYNIGLSSVLGGTGMCIATDVLERFGWGATCLTEDMEFTMKALSCGIKTSWAHDAIVYDEKPLTFMQSWYQRKRWAQGHFDVAFRYIPKLFCEGIKRRSIVVLDGIVHLMQPFFLMFSTLFFLSVAFVPSSVYTNVLYQFMPISVWTAIAVLQYLFPILILLKIKAKWSIWRYVILYPVFIYSWVPITFVGFWHRKNNAWSHTKHTRAVSYEDFIKETR